MPEYICSYKYTNVSVHVMPGSFQLVPQVCAVPFQFIKSRNIELLIIFSRAQNKAGELSGSIFDLL